MQLADLHRKAETAMRQVNMPSNSKRTKLRIIIQFYSICLLTPKDWFESEWTPSERVERGHSLPTFFDEIAWWLVPATRCHARSVFKPNGVCSEWDGRVLQLTLSWVLYSHRWEVKKTRMPSKLHFGNVLISYYLEGAPIEFRWNKRWSLTFCGRCGG